MPGAKGSGDQGLAIDIARPGRDGPVIVPHRHAVDARIGHRDRLDMDDALAEPGVDAVRVLTHHAAKGLEFEHVIVPGLNRGEFATGGDSVDNRNLLYVAMTRARQRLTLMCDRDRPSAYLKDAGLL